MSDSTLLRQLKRLTGLSPVQYLQEIRLNEARSILEQGTPVSISTLASQVGYTDARSFFRSFRNRFGKLPGEQAVTIFLIAEKSGRAAQVVQPARFFFGRVSTYTQEPNQNPHEQNQRQAVIEFLSTN